MNYENRERLGELLVTAGVISDVQLESALVEQDRHGGKLGQVLVGAGLVTEEQMGQALARQKSLEYVNLGEIAIDRTAVIVLPERMARRRNIVPIAIGEDEIVLAMSNPLDIESIDDVEMRTGLRVRVVVATPTKITAAIDKYIAGADAFQDVVESVDIDEVGSDDASQADEVPVVRLVRQLIREAVREAASDIHVEPTDRSVVVRSRVDGVLHEVMTLPAAVRAGVTSRLKIMAEMDIAERRRPQDGRIAVKVDERPVDIRVATLPTPYGEAIAMRILNSELTFHSVNDIGMSPENLRTFERMLGAPYGAILISGPTGSGKSTTLYAGLQELNEPTRKIITVEDPVEYRMAGLTQVAINARIGLTFAAGLRTILRSDPDVVMVGEVRDPETAEVAVRAALTGHLVLSSIHTNDAPSALTRLTDMGVPPYITSSGVVGIVAQRLVRVLCLDCKSQEKVSGARLLAAGFSAVEAKAVKPYTAVGCPKCSQSGYRGRLGVFEVMDIDDEMIRTFLDRAPAEELRKIAIANGMIPMRRDALDKVAAGITSLEEVDRVVI